MSTLAAPVTDADLARLNQHLECFWADLRETDNHLDAATKSAARARARLKLIHDEELYLVHPTAATWERFCAEVLRISLRTAYRVLRHAHLDHVIGTATANLAECQSLPDFSSVAEITQMTQGESEVACTYPESVQVHAWIRAKEEADGKNPGPKVLKKHLDEVYAEVQKARKGRAEDEGDETADRPEGPDLSDDDDLPMTLPQRLLKDIRTMRGRFANQPNDEFKGQVYALLDQLAEVVNREATAG